MAPRHDQAQKSTAEVPEIGESKAPFFVGKRSTNLKPEKFHPLFVEGIFFLDKFKERWVDEIPFHLLKVYISLVVDIFGD